MIENRVERRSDGRRLDRQGQQKHKKTGDLASPNSFGGHQEIINETSNISEVRFDEASKIFEVNLRELAEEEGFRRVGFDRGDGWRRLGLGTQVHSRVLAARAEAHSAYRSEVYLQARVPVEDWTAVVTGRLDGCVERATGHWLIEEFKSTNLSVEGVRPSGYAFERDRRQLLGYCYLWRRLGHGRVTGALVYVDIETGEELSIDVPYDGEESDRQVEARLHRWLGIWRSQEAIRRRKAVAAERLPFPHTAPRPIQQKLMEAVDIALSQGEILLAELPTGSGKTAAALYPALQRGLKSGKQVVFLTSKTLQQNMAVSALTAMNERAFTTLQMRAKEKMCANDRIICHEEFCRFARNYPEKMVRSQILGRLRDAYSHHDPAMVFEEARREEVCPFEVQLELAERADAIVADYNYVFEPGVALRHLVGPELSDAILVIDEAHNLPDRARQIFSPEILEEDLRALMNRLVLQPGDLFESLVESITELIGILEQTAESLPEGEAIAEVEPPTDEIQGWRAEWEPKLLRYLAWKRETRIALPDDPVLDVHFCLQRFSAVLSRFGADSSCVVERGNRGVRLALVCLDPARALAPTFEAVSSAILMSATLTPAETFQRVLGLPPERTSSMSLPPPFPPENRKVMILPQVRTTYTARERNYGRIAALITE